MKFLVAYWTLTGNTKKVAETIFEALSGDKMIKPFDEVNDLDGIDLAFVGFPVMKFGLPRQVRNFIETHTTGKKIALFVTHAMLSRSDDRQQQAMLAKELEKCRSACDKSELVGLFHCQGELSEAAARELLASNIPMLMEFAAMQPLTAGHPDADELEQARSFVRNIHSPPTDSISG